MSKQTFENSRTRSIMPFISQLMPLRHDTIEALSLMKKADFHELGMIDKLAQLLVVVKTSP